MIYLDNAATTFDKPEAVINAVSENLRVANPGRSGHALAEDAARKIYFARHRLTEFFGAASSDRLVFTKNATEALNIIIHGLLRQGGHAVVGALEHNSVMRPLNYLAKNVGVTYDVFHLNKDGTINEDELSTLVRDDTRLIITTGASNVTGEIFPVRELGLFARSRGIPLAVDAAQTAGALPIHIEDDYVDYLAFTGHKHLFGPQGTGGLVLGETARIPALYQGGTGSRSDRIEQPDFLPDMLESGTLNAPGIVGLSAAVKIIKANGLDSIRTAEQALTRKLMEGLSKIDRVTLQGPVDAGRRVGTVSLTIDGKDVGVVARVLSEEYDIMVRPGLHCAPSAHRELGTFPSGTIRMSLTWMNRPEEIDEAVDAIEEISSQRN